MKPETRILKEGHLTNRQKAFCIFYVTHWNSAQAAIEAGYNPKSAKVIGCQNLTKLNIKTYVEYCKAHLEEICGISKKKIIDEHYKIAFSNIAKLHDTWINRKEFETLSDNEKACI